MQKAFERNESLFLLIIIKRKSLENIMISMPGTESNFVFCHGTVTSVVSRMEIQNITINIFFLRSTSEAIEYIVQLFDGEQPLITLPVLWLL